MRAQCPKKANQEENSNTTHSNNNPSRRITMKRFMNKKVATIGLAAGLALGAAGAAFAYFTTTGNGGGTTTAGTAGTLTLNANIAGNIVPGDGGQSVTFTADNSGATSLKVANVIFGSVTSTTSACQTFLTANPGEFSMVTVPSGTVVPGNSTGTALAGTGTLVWADSATVDQTPCAGANITLGVTSN
jgi:hypothetical protein